MDRKYLKSTADFLKGEQPRIILDIGCGWGALGEFVKELLPSVVIDAVDIDERSIEKAYKRSIFGIPVYRNVMIADIRKFDFWCEPYDIYLGFNVFDKMKKDEAMRIINSLKGRLLICLPLKPIPQGPQFGNVFTERVSFWEHDEIMGFASKCIHKGFIYGVYFV